MNKIELKTAKWIWGEYKSREGHHDIIRFRREFDVPEGEQCKLIIHVTADSRYRLFLNGQSVSIGPSKGNQFTHYFETVDVSHLVHPGKNVLAARVVHFAKREPFIMGQSGPVSVTRSVSGGFLLEGSLQSQTNTIIERLDTNQKWKYLRDESLNYIPEPGTFFLGGVEHVDGTLVPHQWEQVLYDDHDWNSAVVISDIIDTRYGLLKPWQLTPRTIPFLYEKKTLFRDVVRISDDRSLSADTIKNVIITEENSDLHISPNSKVILELDAGELTTGYLHLEVSGGKESVIRILCSECYEQEPDPSGKRNKGLRDDYHNGKLFGANDVYHVSGNGTKEEGKRETYEPFWFRTFRFVRLEIETKSNPIVIHRFNYDETGYPLEVHGQFESSDPSLNPLWDISIRTLLRCMHETYEDCPFREQLQYTMDSYLEMLFTYAISGDDRLARKTIHDFHSSLLPSGMLQSRFPSADPQVIPGFAIYWILMVYEHYKFYGDLKLVRRYRSTIDAVLGWFDRRIDETGLVGNMPEGYWSFVDWVEEWDSLAGVPTAKLKGPITIYSLMYSVALQKAAELFEQIGWQDAAKEYKSRSSSLNTAVFKNCWSEEKELFQDGPKVEEYSQHVQIWSVLAEAVDQKHGQSLMNKTLESQELSKVSYCMSYFLFRALAKVGLYDKSFQLWDVWRQLVDLNLTTWVEDPVGQSSDCHGWGAVPLYEFPHEILGVQPGLPGFKRIRIAPRIGHLRWAKGTVCTPMGDVRVAWELDSQNQFHIEVNGPADVPVDLVLPDGSVESFNEGLPIRYQFAVSSNYIPVHHTEV